MNEALIGDTVNKELKGKLLLHYIVEMAST